MNIKLLKNKDFVLLVAGQYISAVGSAMQSFALSLYVLSITQSGGKFASVLAISVIPRLILGPVAGVFVDRLDRKKIIIYLNILSGIVTAVCYVLSITSGLELLHIYIVVIALSIISSLFNPAINTAIPSIMKKEELVDANSLSSVVITTSSIISPMLAGALYGFLGLPIILLLNAVSFFIAAFMEIFINLPLLDRKNTRFTYTVFKKDFMEGVKCIVDQKLIKKIIICAFIINFAFTPMMTVGLVYLAKIVLKVSDIQYGMQQTIFVLGALIGPIIASRIAKKHELSKIFYIGIFLVGCLVAFIALDTSKFFVGLFAGNIIPFAAMVFTGMVIMAVISIINISISTMLQRETPLELFGRVNSVQTMAAMSAVPLGQMLFGLLFDIVPSYIVVLTTSISLIITALLFRRSIILEKKQNMESQTC